VVYAKPPFGGPEHVLRYLGRYTHRVAISNHRLVSFADGTVTFRWRDSAHNNEQKILSLSVDEFLRRFLLHLLPKGFVRIRNFGFLANRRRAATLPLCFQLLSSTPAKSELTIASSSDAWLCPNCGGPMLVIERLTAAEVQLRSPPGPGCRRRMRRRSTSRNFAVLPLATSLCVFLSNQSLFPTLQGHPYCTTFELLSNLLLSRLGAVLFCVCPSRCHTYSSSIEFA
jgi:hypothetical protein